jgi:hypothetical protein
MNAKRIKHACMGAIIGMIVTGCGSDSTPEATGGGGGAGGGGGGTTQSGQGIFVYEGSTKPADLATGNGVPYTQALLSLPVGTVFGAFGGGSPSIAAASLTASSTRASLARRSFRRPNATSTLTPSEADTVVLEGNCGGTLTSTSEFLEGGIATGRDVYSNYCEVFGEGTSDEFQTVTNGTTESEIVFGEFPVINKQTTTYIDYNSTETAPGEPPLFVTMNGVEVSERQSDTTTRITVNLDWTSSDIVRCRINTGVFDFAVINEEEFTIDVVSGRFFFSPTGFVDVTGTMDQDQGVLFFAGANNSQSRVTLNFSGQNTIEYDSNGDGVYESSETFDGEFDL